MTSPDLPTLLRRYIGQIDELLLVADQLVKAQNADDFERLYRRLVNDLRQLHQNVQRKNREITKQTQKTPKLIRDPRLAWFNTFFFAVSKAATHRRPAVNSRNVTEIQSAVYVIECDLQRAVHSMKDELHRHT